MNANLWIEKWFVENVSITKEELQNKKDENYFENGWIDSLQFINFITDIEANFNITLSNDEFQDRNLSTVNGISEIIERKIKENEL